MNKDIILNKNCLEKVRSKYILKQIFNNLNEKNTLNIIKYNKKLKKKLNKSQKDYMKFCVIEIAITTKPQIYGNFLNIINEKEKQFFHIYFDKNKHKQKKTYFEHCKIRN